MITDTTTEVQAFSQWAVENKSLILSGVTHILFAIGLFFVGLFLGRLSSESLKKVLTKRGVDNTVTQFFSALLRYAVVVFFIVAALQRIGVETSSMVAVIGAAGLAVGLALQGSLANFAAGVMLVTFRPIRSGEYAMVGAVSGTIHEINIFSTTLTTPDNKTVIVPNGKIISGEITNFTRQMTRRVDLSIGVANTASVAQVKEVIGTVIQCDPRVMRDHGVTVRLMELTPTAMNFVVRVWAPNKQYWDVYFDLLEQIKTALDENKIPMPYPHMHVHLPEREISGDRSLTL
jgi:Small-conductance mechanosensitive channel